MRPIPAGPLRAARSWLKQTTSSPIKGSSARVSTIRSATVVRQRFFGILWPLFLAGSERLRDNRRMTDAAHNQHSETRRPSDRDRIKPGPAVFSPPVQKCCAEMMSVSVAGIQKNRCRTTIPERMNMRTMPSGRFGRPGCALNRPTWSLIKGSSARVSPLPLCFGVQI